MHICMQCSVFEVSELRRTREKGMKQTRCLLVSKKMDGFMEKNEKQKIKSLIIDIKMLNLLAD